MNMATRCVAVAALVLLPLTSYGAGMKEGLWEISSSMEMPDMPMKIPPQVVKHCYTKEEVSDQKKVINRDKNCTVKEMKVSGNKVTWRIECTGENSGTMTGETIFSETSYTSSMKMQSRGQKMSMKVKGKRLGNCP